MKTQTTNTRCRQTAFLLLLATTVYAAQLSPSYAQGTAFTYQGRLNNGTNLANGLYDMSFTVYDAASGGTKVAGPTTNSPTRVTDGTFTVVLDFGASVFPGANRWLEIAVWPTGGGGYNVLSPRQQLTPTPYAITAGNLQTGASPVFTGTPTFSPASGPPFNVNTSAKVSNLNADLLDGLDSTAFVLKAGDTMTGSLTIANPATLSFGSTVRQMLNLWDVQYGIGVQANTLYNRSHNNFAWFKDGTHSDTVFDPGAGGKVLMTLDYNSRLNVPALNTTATLNDVTLVGLNAYPIAVNASASGDGSTGVAGRAGGVGSVGVYGEATTTSGKSYGMQGISHSLSGIGIMGADDTTGGIGLYGYAGSVSGAPSGNGNTGVYGESAQSNGNGVVGVANSGTVAYGVWGRSTSGYAGAFSGAVRIDFSSPPTKPQLYIEDPSNSGFARLRMQTGSQPFWDIAVGTQANPDQTNSLRFFSNSGGDVMTVSPQGHVHLKVLSIDGGADVAEPFEMSEANLSKGAVVVIDPEHPGRLKLSTTAYDTRVAGVISGAGGVNPGLNLNQRGVIEGDQPVSLSGRVYVQADATYGSIQPGDLLTTSDTPGHAMKVADYDLAHGAILGKAMTSLKAGQGLVLVLVTLQ